MRQRNIKTRSRGGFFIGLNILKHTQRDYKMPKLILDSRTMRIIRAPKPTHAKAILDVPATQTPTPTPTPIATSDYTLTTELPAVDTDGRVVLTYR